MIIEYGNPTTVSVDYTTGLTTMYSDYTERTDIPEMIGEELEAHDKITVMVSGGLDSQFSAAVAKKYHDNVSAVIFDFIWEGTTINGLDIYNAIKFCKSIDLDYEIVEHEIKNFLEEDLIDFARDFKTQSPQVAVHLHAIQKLDPKGCIMLGGDFMWIGMYNDVAICPHVPEKNLHGKITNDSTIHIRNTAPYALLGKAMDREVIKNPFMLTPTLLYASLNHNLQVIKDTKQVFNLDSKSLKKSTAAYKKAYYNSFNLNLSPPFIKRTGFEHLRMQLASDTGMYDEFNNRFRKPLAQIAHDEKWLGPMLLKGTPTVVEGDFKNILDKVQNFCNENDVQECNTYEIDW